MQSNGISVTMRDCWLTVYVYDCKLRYMQRTRLQSNGI